MVKIEPRNSHEPKFARDEIGVLALPAEPGLRRDRLFHHRSGVDEDLDLAGCYGLHARGERLELRLDDVVIVGALRIDRDGAARAHAKRLQRVPLRPVAKPKHDDAFGLGPDGAGRLAPIFIVGEPCHVAVAAGCEKIFQGGAGARRRVGTGEPHRGEAQFIGLACDPFFQRKRHDTSTRQSFAVQKSRSA